MRMAKISNLGVIVVSVDLEPPVSGGVAAQRMLDRLTPQLIELFDRHRVRATWAVADPIVSAATERLQSSHVPHEIAVLGDATWAGPHAARGRFAGELSRRVLRARAAGLAVSSLAMVEPIPTDHYDLLLKQGITAVRAPGQANTGRVPQSLRYRLWQLPVSHRLPAANRWFAAGSWAAQRGLRRAAAQQSLYHLEIDAPRLGGRGSSALRSLERLLRQAARLQQQRRVEILTMAETVARLSATPSVVPARSVLRKAA